jgi:hypothetical protein
MMAFSAAATALYLAKFAEVIKDLQALTSLA